MELEAYYARVNEFLVSLPAHVAVPGVIGPEYNPIWSTDAAALARLGINVSGPASALFLVAQDVAPGSFASQFTITEPGAVVVLGRTVGLVHMHVRIVGADSLLVAPELTGGICNLQNVFMRSAQQRLYWGRGATAVQASIEIEGRGSFVAVGDDCMLSSGIWLRNHDMHCMFDLKTGAVINRNPAPIVLERHVWLGQDALVMGGVCIGAGSVIGARSLVRTDVPPRVAAAGLPARVIRSDIGWARPTVDIDPIARAFYGLE